MRRYLLVLLLGLFLHSAQAQSNNAQLNQRLREYIAASEKMDIDRIMDFTYSKVYTLIPKETMAAALKQGMDNPMFAMSLDSMRLIKVSEPFVHEGIEYRKVDYAVQMTMAFKDTTMANDDMGNTIVESMKTMYSTADIRYRNHAIFIKRNADMVAVLDPEKKQWTFVGNEKNKEMMESIFPQAVITKFELL